MTMDSLKELTSIIVLCYLIAEGYKVIFKKKYHKYIPVIVGSVGGILSILIFLIYKETFGTDNIFNVIAIGIVSGLASTGTNQAVKQLIKQN